jgi:hypothetical protein
MTWIAARRKGPAASAWTAPEYEIDLTAEHAQAPQAQNRRICSNPEVKTLYLSASRHRACQPGD